MLTQLTAKKFKGSVEWLSFHDEDRQGKLRFASYIILISNLPTFSMLHNVDQPKGWNPVSEQYDVYRWINLNAITVLTTLGISNVSPSKSFNFLFRTSHLAKKNGLESDRPLLDAVYFALSLVVLSADQAHEEKRISLLHQSFILRNRDQSQQFWLWMVTNKNHKYLLSSIPWICIFIELY